MREGSLNHILVSKRKEGFIFLSLLAAAMKDVPIPRNWSFVKNN